MLVQGLGARRAWNSPVRWPMEISERKRAMVEHFKVMSAELFEILGGDFCFCRRDT